MENNMGEVKETRYATQSEHGLRRLITDNEKRIQDKRVEYDNVEELYNPLCADGWRREITNDIKNIEAELVVLNEVLNIRLDRINNCKNQTKWLPKDDGSREPWCDKIQMVCPNKTHACEWYKKDTEVKKIK